jgi:hypothetical protein
MGMEERQLCIRRLLALELDLDPVENALGEG